jgi:predicted dehydrogenase
MNKRNSARKEEGVTRREFAAVAAFTIVPRSVLGGAGWTAPSDRITLASIGMGRQGMAVTMELLPRPDVQVVAVCDCNRAGRDYAEYSDNALLASARRLLGTGYEKWGDDLASPGAVNLTHSFRTSLGMGGREPAQRLVEAYYASRSASGTYSGCHAYRDFRELLEKEKDLDAVYIATPDHWHAPISIAAMRKRKHVLCQKPMTHTVAEARRVAAVAKEMNVATSVVVNNPTSEPTKLISAWLGDGAIGRVSEVHNWSSRPYWPQGIERPAAAMTVPEGLDWEMWVGPAQARPYNKAYLPFVWRGWFDFGCGSFGDMGCYSFAGLFKILGLAPPVSVEASSSDPYDETYPQASIVHLDFVRERQPFRLSWYDGGLMPKRPAGLRDEEQRLFRRRGEGVMYVGEKGILLGGFNGQNPRVYPESAKYMPPQRDPNAPAPASTDTAIDLWLAACKGAPTGPADFLSQSAATEAFLLGCLAQRMPNEPLKWDTAAMRVSSSETANRYIDPPYREPWVRA